jgi:glutamate synthase (NADPH/NADH) small chain
MPRSSLTMLNVNQKRNPKAPRQIPTLATPENRCSGWEEVTHSFSLEQASIEARRCMNCMDPKCVQACPIHVDVKTYIARIINGDFEGALESLDEQNPFPGICGRVCQHELYCEKACLLGKKLEPVAIGSLERFVADLESSMDNKTPVHPRGPKVALVGSGPASMIAAHDLAKKGYRVTIFEALHELGGVLAYGIPPFRLPREVLQQQIEKLRREGVEFQKNVIIGKTITLQELFDNGYSAVFVGTGAGLPHMMNIEGENLIGVYTANEFLTRLNLMRACEFPQTPTPVCVGKRTVIVGGGNSAVDAARWARRLESETTIVFRRGQAELRARQEEIEHAEEEGVRFEFLAEPVRLIGDEAGAVREIECIRMRLGERDASGRPAPVPIEGSEFRVPADTVVAAIGQSPNPMLSRATPQLITKRGKIVINRGGETSIPHVFAGGDAVRGGSTVILAMSDGRAAAAAIDAALKAEAVGSCETQVTTAPEGNRILARRVLTPEIVSLRVEALQIAKMWRPGQFVIVQVDREGERIPLTIVDNDATDGSILLVVQAAGHSTRALVALKPGDFLNTVVGPLGEPATIEAVGPVLCVGGGVGVAELAPVARAFRQAGQPVTALCGARSVDRIILRD